MTLDAQPLRVGQRPVIDEHLAQIALNGTGPAQCPAQKRADVGATLDVGDVVGPAERFAVCSLSGLAVNEHPRG